MEVAADFDSTAQPLRTLRLFSPAWLPWVCWIFDLTTINLPHDHKAAVTTPNRIFMSKVRKKRMICYKQTIVNVISFPSIRKQHILPRSPQNIPAYISLARTVPPGQLSSHGNLGRRVISFFQALMQTWVRKLGIAAGLGTDGVCVTNDWLICFQSSLFSLLFPDAFGVRPPHPHVVARGFILAVTTLLLNPCRDFNY